MPKFRYWDCVRLPKQAQPLRYECLTNTLYLVSDGVNGNNNLMVMLTTGILRDIRDVIQTHIVSN